MSNVILNDHLWTKEEVAYKLARDLRDEVDENRALYGPGGAREGEDDSVAEDEVKLELDRDVYEHVVSLDVPGVQAELKELGLSTKGDEQELKGRLAQALQEKKDDDSNH